MIWKIPEMIAVLSQYFELAAGDVVMTGTPSGVGPVQRGDVLARPCGGAWSDLHLAGGLIRARRTGRRQPAGCIASAQAAASVPISQQGAALTHHRAGGRMADCAPHRALHGPAAGPQGRRRLKLSPAPGGVDCAHGGGDGDFAFGLCR